MPNDQPRIVGSIKFENDQPVDLTTYAQWLPLQSPATIAEVLDLTAKDLYRRRNWPSVAWYVKTAARDLRALTRHREGAQ